MLLYNHRKISVGAKQARKAFNSKILSRERGRESGRECGRESGRESGSERGRVGRRSNRYRGKEECEGLREREENEKKS